MVTNELKTRIVAALAEKRANFGGSEAKFAMSLGISHAQYSRIKNGEVDRILSDANWISLARICELSLNNAPAWKFVLTPTSSFILEQLNYCQENASSRLLCDVADIGKTISARHYVKSNRNAVYIDCSQVKTKQKLVRFIAQSFGVGHTGKYADVYADLVFYIRSLSNPLVILDEAGDLEYAAFLELKALWNATERACGWYMMGADGLREKVRRAIDGKKVGYTELFSRYGNKYQKASPDSSQEMKSYKAVHASMIIKANAPEGVNIQQLIVKSDYSLRRIFDELRKIS